MSDLFSRAGLENDVARPLADRLRPARLDEVAGQAHLVGPDGALTRLLDGGSLGSLIFWGPPGTGKTTVRAPDGAADQTRLHRGLGDLLGCGRPQECCSKRHADAGGQGAARFSSSTEIHRFNRAQQDGFLPVMEDGTVTLIGATTENPSFGTQRGLASSRARVLVFHALDPQALGDLLARAEATEGRPLPLSAEAREALVRMADGDGRALLNLAEDVWRAARAGEALDTARLIDVVQRRAPLYDKGQDGHYNLISALHKAVRGSDPDAALYYLARMFDAGEDRLFLARRIVRMASEDIGLADPQALVVANAAKDAFDFLGSPEGELAIAEAVVYLATAPKSNAVYTAYKAAMALAKEHGSLLPPKTILNAPTKVMKREGYGEGYRYDHDEPDAFSGQDYWPDSLGRQTIYHPVDRGYEREVGRRLAWWHERRGQR